MISHWLRGNRGRWSRRVQKTAQDRLGDGGMEVMPQCRQHIGDEAGLAHRLSLMHEYIPIQGGSHLADQRIQLVTPQKRRVLAFMEKVEAEMKYKIRLAERPCIHIHQSLRHGSCPYRLHGSGVDERWVDQGPMGFDNDTILRVNELERIGKGFQKTWSLFVLCIAELVEDLLDSR